MFNFYIDDYGRSAAELQQKYELKFGEHRGYPKKDWREAVAKTELDCGYWAWVRNQLQDEQDGLDSDNPYTQGI